MTRLKALNPETSSGKSKELFNGIQSNLGMIPNMMRTMGASPAVLEGYLSLSGALSKGNLGASLGELIAIVVAQNNSCDYCLSAHTFIGKNLVKIDDTEVEAAKQSNNKDEKIKTALNFAEKLVVNQGKVNDFDVELVLNAGYSEGDVGEIIAHVALNIFTNYFNNTANTENDFAALLTN